MSQIYIQTPNFCCFGHIACYWLTFVHLCLSNRPPSVCQFAHLSAEAHCSLTDLFQIWEKSHESHVWRIPKRINTAVIQEEVSEPNTWLCPDPCPLIEGRVGLWPSPGPPPVHSAGKVGGRHTRPTSALHFTSQFPPTQNSQPQTLVWTLMFAWGYNTKQSKQQDGRNVHDSPPMTTVSVMSPRPRSQSSTLSWGWTLSPPNLPSPVSILTRSGLSPPLLLNSCVKG